MWKTLQNKKQAATLGNDGCRCSKFQRIGLTLAASGLVDEYSSIVVRLAKTSWVGGVSTQTARLHTAGAPLAAAEFLDGVQNRDASKVACT